MSISIENLLHIYDKGSPYETISINNVSLNISDNEFLGLIGHTGSGKSTLIQHMNGLIKPFSGKIIVNDLEITQKGNSAINVRKKVGLVFQYPEYQLFEETVYKDIAFGPSNLKLSNEEIDIKVKNAMKYVNLDFNTYKDKSPFELSGGEKRRVAIAGVLALDPEILILDEPTAGLDPKGRDEILDQINDMHKKRGTTVILVSHSMEEIAKYVDRIIVMDKGKIVLDDKKEIVFSNVELLESIGLGVPQVTKLFYELNNKGYKFNKVVTTIDEAIVEILNYDKVKENA
jgi:energy-coupling factor transport system ATP-binding protein